MPYTPPSRYKVHQVCDCLHVCQKCFAIVDSDNLEAHNEWHKDWEALHAAMLKIDMVQGQKMEKIEEHLKMEEERSIRIGD